MKERKRLRKVILLLLAICLTYSSTLTCFAAHSQNTVKNSRVLFISSYDYDWDSVPRQLKGFSSEISGKAKVDYIFMDTKTHTYKEVKSNIYEKISKEMKQNGAYDLVVLGDDAALDFAQEYRSRLFSKVPIVFEGINSEQKAKRAKDDPLMTGVIERFPMEETIKLATKFYPKAKRVVAIVDDSESCKGSMVQYKDAKKTFPELKLDELNCSKLTKREIQQKVATYGDDTILLFLMITHVKTGYDYSQKESVRLITKAAKIPVFKADELGIGDGILGGAVISYETMGKIAGKMACSILNGTSPQKIPIEAIPYHVKVDENILKQFHLSTNLLPENTVVMNHTPTVWERYKKALLPTGGIILSLMIVIAFIILWNRRKKQYYADMKEKDLMLDSILTHMPGGVAVYKMGEKIETLYSSDGIPAMGGRSMEEYQEWIQGDIFQNTIYEEDVNRVKDAVLKAVEKREKFDIAYRLKHKNGQMVWTQLSAVMIREEDKIPVYYGVFTSMPQESILYRSIIADSPIAIYICDSENYNMLYANEILMQDVGNTNFAGKKCYEYLLHRTCPCEDCKLHNMKIGDYTQREYELQGRHLNLRGTIFNWHGIKAHIEYVVDDTYRYQVQKEKEAKYETQMKLLSKVSKNCIGNFRVNLSKNQMATGYGPNIIKALDVGIDNSVDTWLKKAKCFSTNVDEWEEFSRIFQREHLMREFQRGTTTISMEHRMKLDEETIHWCKSTMIMMENPTTEDIEGYLYVEDINTGKIRKKLTEKVMQDSREMLICIDVKHDSHIVFTSGNTSAPIFSKHSKEDMVDYVLQRLEEKNAREILHKLDPKVVIDVLEEKERYSFSIPLMIAGCKKYYQATFLYVDKRNDLLGLILTDITSIYEQQRVQEDKLKEALARAQDANVAKTDFLARMSHDMRTPMNGILGLCHMMEDEEDMEEIKKNLEQLKGAGQYLLQLITDVLDVNKIESKVFKLYPGVCNEEEIFEEIISLMKPQMEEKNLEFHFVKKNIQWKYMLLDAQRVKQIFINLLSNAIKFTPKGGTIDFYMELVSEENHIIRDKFVIKDSGIGMSEEFLPKVFLPFEQENRMKEDLGGTGLGLSIVKKLVELMDGSIEIESQLNEGTCVTLYLNFPVAQEPKQDEKKKDMETSNLQGRRFLLCEDHPLNAKITMKLLEKKGAFIDWVENGQEGVDTFWHAPKDFYDAVLMDIRMPILDGLEASKAIRSLQREDATTIPIIAMTANAYEEDRRKSLEAGMTDYLTKPIEPDKMYDTIRKYMK